MRLIKLKSYQQDKVFVKLHSKLIEPFSEPFQMLGGTRPSVLRLDRPQQNSNRISTLQRQVDIEGDMQK